MSVEHARNYVHLFEECQTRIQTLGELLLIPCKPHPVFTHKEDLTATSDTFIRYRDQVIGHLNKMLILSQDISCHIHGDNFRWKAFHQPVTELTATVVQLTQLSAHIAYLLALNVGASKPAIIGPVASRHRLVQADLELRFICSHLKHSQAKDLNPDMLVDMCGTVTKCLSSTTEICREAAEKIMDTSEQDQFKLCIKAITSTTGCLLSSVKSFKDVSNESHLQRVVSFCQPVVSTSAALLAFATEEQFLGRPAELSHDANEMYKSVVGLAMSMVSACVQITKAARDLVHDPTHIKHKERVSLCVESISRSASRLRDLLLSYEFVNGKEVPLPAVGDIDEHNITHASPGGLAASSDNIADNSCYGGNVCTRHVNDLYPSPKAAEDNSSQSCLQVSNTTSASSRAKRTSLTHCGCLPHSSHRETASTLSAPREQTLEPSSPSSSSPSSSSSSSSSSASIASSTKTAPAIPVSEENSETSKENLSVKVLSHSSLCATSLDATCAGHLQSDFQERL